MRIILTADERAAIEATLYAYEHRKDTATPHNDGIRAIGAFLDLCQSLVAGIDFNDMPEPVAAVRAILARAETERDEPLTAEGELANNLAEMRGANGTP